MPKSAKIPAVRFNLKDKDTTAPTLIYLVFRYAKKRLKFSTGEKVIPRYWDVNTQRAKYTKAHPEYVGMNERLNHWQGMTTQIFKDYDFGELDLEQFKYELNVRSGKIEKEKEITFFDFIKEYIEMRKSEPNAKRGTWKRFITIQNNLKDYATDRKIKNLDFEDIDMNFYHDFKSWLYDGSRKHAINNAAKVFKIIKQFLRAAYKKGYHQNLIFNDRDFGVKRVPTQNKIRLDFRELNTLRKLDLSDRPAYDRVRDLFIVGCYTGLRFSDWHKVNRENMVTLKGHECMQILTQKTTTPVYVPCLPELKTVLEKYDYQLPSISPQNFNRTIKEVCKLASIDTKFLRIYSESGKELSEKVEKWKKVSSHCARRSFASNFYGLKLSPHILMQITGHASERQFFEYIDKDPVELAVEFAVECAKNADRRFLRVA